MQWRIFCEYCGVGARQTDVRSIAILGRKYKKWIDKSSKTVVIYPPRSREGEVE